MQLWQLRGTVRRVRWRGSVGRVLLSGMRSTGEGQGRMSKDCQPWQHKDGLVLRTKEVWLQEAIASRTVVPHSLCIGACRGVCERVAYLEWCAALQNEAVLFQEHLIFVGQGIVGGFIDRYALFAWCKA